MAVEMTTQELPAAGKAGDEGHCEVLQGADGPVYFLHQGLLFIVHDLLGRWTEPGEEHWLVTASVGRFGEPALYRLRCRFADSGIGSFGDVGSAGHDGGAAPGVGSAGEGASTAGEMAGGSGLRRQLSDGAQRIRRPGALQRGPAHWTVRRAAGQSVD